jgi:polyferredoxin|tara:strand:+ start:80 stop:496 length:417 start_codon:yes stop_codon:yes gene_type:complete
MNKLFDEKLSEIELPSNKKFGYFFTLIFLIITGYFFLNKSLNLAYVFAAISITLFFITLVKADLLLYPNKLWIQFGLLLGMIISPIVLGVLFFVLFTPTAIIMKLYGRDELRIKFKKSTSYWIVRENQINSDSFSNQF